MTPISFQQTATIIAFPTRNRPAFSGKADFAGVVTTFRPALYADAAFGGGWYHEAAINDADKTPKS